jgi:putative permease
MGGDMLSVFKQWGSRYWSDPEAILMSLLLLVSIGLLMWMGPILKPILASIVIAYFLQWIVKVLISWKVPRTSAVILVYLLFLSLFLLGILVLWPIIGQQLMRLYAELPTMSIKLHQFLKTLPEQFPQFLTNETVDGWLANAILQLKLSSRTIISASIATLPSVMTMVVYVVLIPMMVFFFLKDSGQISKWVVDFLPKKRKMFTQVWKNVDGQIGNYILGKVVEAFIVGSATYTAFYFLNMSYTMLLSVLVGMSVLIPYIGAIVVTIPVVLVGLFQWGWGTEFAYMLIAYTIIQTLDGAILVPLLFSKAVSLHPLAIIIAILVFGGWWGFWGAFFAIPLATLVRAIIQAWPVKKEG